MKYEEFDKLVEEPNPEKQALFNRIIYGLPYPAEIWNTESPGAATAAPKQAEKPASKWRTSFKNFFKAPARLAACVSAAVAVACLAIILPFTLNSGSGPQTATTTPPSTSEDRFCAAAACKEIELKYSLKEYSASNNLSLLYVDWYDVADIKTSLHVNKEDSTDIIYYQEILEHKHTGSIVELYVTDAHTKVDKFGEYAKVCRQCYVKNLPFGGAYWGIDRVVNGSPYSYKAWFRYDEYNYFIELIYPMTENDIFELIDSMLSIKFNAASNNRS